MPRRPRFRTAALRELFEGLRYAPDETRRRQMEAAEALAFDIEPISLLERGEIVRRITGFRPEARDDEPSLVGQAVLADLTTLIERLSEDLGLRASDRPGGAVTLVEAAERLGVSQRSLLRCREVGLLVHWIDFAEAPSFAGAARAAGAGESASEHRRVGCYVSLLDRFREKRLHLVPKARPRRGAPDAEMRREILKEAARLTERERREGRALTLHRATGLVADACGRDRLSVRRVLAESDFDFAKARKRSLDETRLAYRAWRRGVDPAQIARRLGRDHAACWRAINSGRRAALRSASIPTAPELPLFTHPQAAEVLLAPREVQGGLHATPEPRTALEFLEAHAPAALPPKSGDPQACRRLVAMRFLLWRARRSLMSLRGSPTGGELDEIETDLRNAWLLRRTLLAFALPLVLARAEAALGGRLPQLPSRQLVRAISRSVRLTASALDSADGVEAAEGRLRVARHAALIIDRDMAASPPPALDRRAAAVHTGMATPLPDIDLLASPWVLLLPHRFPPAGSAAPSPLIECRFGWTGHLALTLAEQARQERLAPSLLQHRLSEALAQHRRANLA
ncbi:MAG: hypothetical protein KF724_07240 [Phycisphaeraceae bacterium]|nr:hypothetical protein [Phycisphaeraceae bacterium]